MSAEDAILLVDAVQRLSIIVGVILLVQLVSAIILSIYLMEKKLQSDGIKRTEAGDMTKKYVYSFSDDVFLGCSKFETLKEALKAAREEAKLMPEHEYVYIGVAGDIWEPTIDGDGIIEMLQEMADEAVGDVADGYLADVPEEDVRKLTNALTETVKKWAAENGYLPTFYTVENIKEYPLRKEGECQS